MVARSDVAAAVHGVDVLRDARGVRNALGPAEMVMRSCYRLLLAGTPELAAVQ